MQTLTETAYWSRNAIKYGIAFVLFLILARVAWQVGFGVYRHFFPAPPPKPTVLYGKLPELRFPEIATTPLTYTLETPEGNLPQTATIMTVYVQPRPHSSLVALDEARTTARRLGFDGTEEAISPNLYRFSKKDSPARLEMNIITGAFSLGYDLNADPTPLTSRAPSGEVAAATIRSFLSGANLYPADFTKGKTVVTFLKNSDGKLSDALSLSDANFVRVDFFRENYNEIPIITGSGKQGNIWFLVSGSSRNNILTGVYRYFKVNLDDSSTYPLKTSQEAWDELKNGSGKIASPGAIGNNNVVIRRVYLAYYDDDQPQDFFQPVFVFEGDNGFLAYVPAVASGYYGK
ncbi:hypothetical protein HY404_01585 [Candidatus Microgenomates bacterium]|nr:hypothetical protein [Candidatus Microgenomates bacterium]